MPAEPCACGGTFVPTPKMYAKHVRTPGHRRWADRHGQSPEPVDGYELRADMVWAK